MGAGRASKEQVARTLRPADRGWNFEARLGRVRRGPPWRCVKPPFTWRGLRLAEPRLDIRSNYGHIFRICPKPKPIPSTPASARPDNELRLQALNHTKDRLLSIVSHDLRSAHRGRPFPREAPGPALEAGRAGRSAAAERPDPPLHRERRRLDPRFSSTGCAEL